MALCELERTRLSEKARQIRRLIVRMITDAGSGHVGPALSCADIVASLYFGVMKIDPSDPKWEDRDRFILSAGHKCSTLYAALALRGFFDLDVLSTYLKDDTLLGGHPLKGLPGVELPTGSLGHGLSIGAGMALAARLKGKEYKVYVLLGDGELAEGSVWEAAMAASHFRLTNLVAVVDRNMLQIDGRTEDVMCLEPLAERWRSFGWGTREVSGHDLDSLCEALSLTPAVGGRPTVVIARTVKGKGVSFIENRKEWHYKATTSEEAAVALRELESGQGG